MQTGKKLSLVFHTAFQEEFSGETPEDIVHALYENSKKGMGEISFEEWWQYQKTLWESKYQGRVPAHDDSGAAQALLAILIKVGALEQGELPKKTPNDGRGLDVG